MRFRASFCDPFRSDIIELGELSSAEITALFEQTDWLPLVKKMRQTRQDFVYYSPSLEVENLDNKNGVCLSIVDEKEWYLFFKRPKLVSKRKWFKTVEEMDPEYLSDLTGQNIHDAKECLEALLRNDLAFLEKKFN